MKANRLLAHYARIADAPDAIPRLRRFILDIAVRGKLADQNLNDEPASELLMRIAAEKALLAKAGELRKSKTPPELPPDEWPFPIPPTWQWSRIAEIGVISPRNNVPDNLTTSFVSMPMISSQYGVDHEHQPRLWASIKKGYTHFAEGDVGLAKITPCFENGKSTVFRNLTGGVGSGTTELHIIRPLFVSPDYIIIFFKCTHFIQTGIDRMTGTAGQRRVPTGYFANAPLPLPPLAEQRRIVTKVHELMTLCKKLEAARTERETTRNRLAVATLARLDAPNPDPTMFQKHAGFALEHLTPLTTRPDKINALRQTILNLAIRGKLVSQDPNDEPASELLKRIALEKARLVMTREIKTEKKHQPIAEDHRTFQIPTSWTWCRLGSLSKMVTSGSRDWAKYYSNEGAVFVRMGNLSKDHYRLRLDNIQRVKAPSDGEGTRTRLETGDLLISITGDVGMLGLIPENFGEAYINQHTAMVRPMDEMKGRYLPELFRSPFAQEQFNAPQRGIKNSFRLTDITQFLVPLPPLAEQHRIVAKVDELIALCDRLEENLATVDYTRRRLLETVLYDALEPDTDSKAAA